MRTWVSSASPTSTPTSSRVRTSEWPSSSTRDAPPNSLTARRVWRTRGPMPIHRPLGAIVLWGGWLLLMNPPEQQLTAPLSRWKKVHEYDTPYDCQQKRQEKLRESLEKNAKKAAPESQLSAGEVELRYVCER